MQQDDVKPVTDDELDALVAALEEEMAAMTPPDDAQPVSVQVPMCTRTDDAQQAAKAKADVLKEWCEKLKNAARQHNQANWLLGDALLDGFDLGLLDDDNESRSLYHLAARVTGFDRQHLRDIASVAKRCPKELRRDDLSWSHHRVLVNALPNASADEMKKWLQSAAEQGQSVKGLTESLKKGAREFEATQQEITVKISKGVYEILTNHFEVRRKLTVEEVILQGLRSEYEKIMSEHQAAMTASSARQPYRLMDKDKERNDEEERKARLARLAQEDTMAEDPDEFMAAKEKDQAD